MYLEHWSLERPPFEAQPDSRFLFPTPQHEQARAVITYAACEGGEPVLLRGMAGSRLTILLDGEQILGGCGARMDPPTAYIFPESYDRITVVKGPQTVLYGPGNSAGTVRFERAPQGFHRQSATGW